MLFTSICCVWLFLMIFSAVLVSISEHKSVRGSVRKLIRRKCPEAVFEKYEKGTELKNIMLILCLLMLTGVGALMLCSTREEKYLDFNCPTTVDSYSSEQNGIIPLSSLCFSLGNLLKPAKLDEVNDLDYFSELKRFRDIPFNQQQYAVLPSSLERYFNDVVPQRTSISVQMRHEWARYESLKDFPQSSPVQPMRLAQNGFYYSGNDDEVICFSCNLKVRNWKDGDIPSLEHQRLSPNCRYVKGTDQSNVSIHDIPEETPMTSMVYQAHESTNYTSADLEMDISNTTDTSSLDGSLHVEHHCASLFINTQRPHKHPDYEELSRRLDTFTDWPCPEIQQPKELAEAGYYSAGFGDCVRCFSCGGGLRNWEYGDGPWEEHARWFPQCRYLLERKGAEFIREHEMHEHSDTDDEGEGAVGHIGQEQVISGTEALLRLKGNNQLTQKNDIVETDTTTNVTEKHTYETEVPPSTNVAECDLIKTLLTMGFAQHAIKMVVETLKRNNTSVTVLNALDKLTAQNHDEKEVLSNIPKNQTNTNEISNKNTTDAAKSSSKKKEKLKDGKILKEENEKLRQLVQCKICMDKDACIVCLPCGHIASCEECAPNLRKCAICRMLIKGRVKAFMA